MAEAEARLRKLKRDTTGVGELTVAVGMSQETKVAESLGIHRPLMCLQMWLAYLALFGRPS